MQCDLGWKLLDHTLISNVAQAAQVDAGTVERYDEHVDSWWHRLNREGLQAWSIAAGVALEDARFFDADRTAELVQQCIAQAGVAGNCVIVGRGAECVLQDREDVLRVFIYAPWKERVARVRARVERGRDLKEVIGETDRERASYIRAYYGCEWKDPHLYHLMISSQIGIERAASTIVSAVLRSGRHGKPMNVFVINAGSSSLKFQVIATDLERIRQDNDELLCRGQVERIGGEAIITVQNRAGSRQKLTAPIRDVSAALDYVLRWLASDRSGIDEIRSLGDIHAAGHRVVHGGELFKESVIINDDVLKGIEDCIDLAPLHNPNNLRGIRAVAGDLRPGDAAGRGLRYRFSHVDSRVRLPLRAALPSLPPSSHPALWISRNVTPLRGVSLPDTARAHTRTNARDHASPG